MRSNISSSSTGYSRQYQALARFLAAQFPSDQLEVTGSMDRGVTGNFEVTVAPSGQVLHSKRHAGQGKAESAAERARIVEQIRELLEERSSFLVCWFWRKRRRKKMGTE